MQWEMWHANKSTNIVNKYWLLKDGLGWTFKLGPQNIDQTYRHQNQRHIGIAHSHTYDEIGSILESKNRQSPWNPDLEFAF